MSQYPMPSPYPVPERRQPPGQRPPNEFPRQRPPNPGPVTQQLPAPQAPAPTPPLAAQQNALTPEQGTADYQKRMQSRYGMSAEDLQNPQNQQWVNKQNAKRRAKAAAPAAAAPTPPMSTPESKPTETVTTAPAPKLPPPDWWTRRAPGYPGGQLPGQPGEIIDPWVRQGRQMPQMPGGRLPEWGPPGTAGSPYGPKPPLTTQTQALKPPTYQW